MQVRAVLALGVSVALAACASTPSKPIPSRPAPARPVSPPAPPPAAPPPPDFVLSPTTFSGIPGWATADLAPALTALRRQCENWKLRTPDATLTGGRYGGSVKDWLPACDIAVTIQPGQERWFFETYFDPQQVTGGGDARLTAYFEPVIDARRQAEPGYSEPLLSKPNDMISVDLSAFAEALDSDTLRGAPRSLTGKMNGSRVEPYPKRAAIQPAPGQVIAWANPSDVYNLQVQGSGRMHFPDGSESRAQFAAQNGYKWSSALGALKNAGRLAAATWAGFRQYLDAHPAEITPTLNADPSYVFFQEEQVADPSAGPKGAAGVPLSAMGSLAIDPAYHPYGAVIFVDGTYDGYAFQKLFVAQDTGGAIRRGPLRGDVFAGSGQSAGLYAEKMNAPARWWTLLPKQFAQPVASLAVGAGD